MPGGKGVFPDMTIDQNLTMAAYKYRRDKADVARRLADRDHLCDRPVVLGGEAHEQALEAEGLGDAGADEVAVVGPREPGDELREPAAEEQEDAQ